MSFELDEAGAREIDEQARLRGVPIGTLPDPTTFAGSGRALGSGLARGIVGKPALLLGEAASPLLKAFVARPLDSTFGFSFEGWLDDQRRKNADALEQWKPDPLTTGFAGQAVHSLVDVGSSAIVFGPAATATFAGFGRRQEDIGKGIDPATATATGLVDAAGTYAGLRIPLTLGKAAVGTGPGAAVKNVAAGATVGVSTGTAEQLAMRELLEQTGYRQHAEAIHPFDTATLTAEALLGGLFSGAAHAIEARATPRGREAIDAALALNQARHAAIDTAPGVPTSARAAAAHASALDTAGAALARNDAVNVGDLAGAEFVRKPSAAQADMQAEVRSHVVDIIGPLKTEADVRRAAQFTDAELARQRAFESSPENLAELRQAIAQEKNPANRVLLREELAKQEAVALARKAEPAPPVVARSEAPRTEVPPPERVASAGRVEPTFTDPTTTGVNRPEPVTGPAPHPLQPILDSFARSDDQVLRAIGEAGTRAQQEPPAAQLQEPAMRAAMAAAEARPDMIVALDDGTQLPAREVIQRAHESRRAAERESTAFEAAVNCFLRTGA